MYCIYVTNKATAYICSSNAELIGLTVLAAFRRAIRPDSITDVNLPTLVNVVALETLKPCHQ